LVDEYGLGVSFDQQTRESNEVRAVANPADTVDFPTPPFPATMNTRDAAKN